MIGRPRLQGLKVDAESTATAAAAGRGGVCMSTRPADARIVTVQSQCLCLVVGKTRITKEHEVLVLTFFLRVYCTSTATPTGPNSIPGKIPHSHKHKHEQACMSTRARSSFTPSYVNQHYETSARLACQHRNSLAMEALAKTH